MANGFAIVQVFFQKTDKALVLQRTNFDPPGCYGFLSLRFASTPAALLNDFFPDGWRNKNLLV